MTHEATTRAYVGAFVDELVRAGVRHVCVSPGSRSTPLAMLVAEHPGARLWMHYDERSSAFFGLGIAKASREPSALVCTSGGAAANFFPAVVEARYARVPLVVLTADRPPELRENGAPQTIDQVKLYGDHAKWFFDLPLPEGSADALRFARTLAGRAVATARASPAGPVHLNMPFREPLVPIVGPSAADDDAVAAGGRPDGAAYAAVHDGRGAPDPALVDRLADELAGVERGLIVCGPQDDPELAPSLAALAGALGYPVLADPLSGVRCGAHDRGLVLDAYDAFLRDPGLAGEAAPEVVLRFGAMPTSKPVLLYLQRHPGARQVVVDGDGGWREPTSLAATHVWADGARLCRALTGRIVRAGGTGRIPSLRSGQALRFAQDGTGSAQDDTASAREDREGEARGWASGWLRRWLEADRAARAAIAGELAGIDEPFEGRVFAELAELLPEGTTLFAGNSMPVRDLDTFFPSSDRAIRMLANRGTNGIDGVVSSALGASVVSSGPLVLVIGDLSLYHDMNGLLAAKLHRLDATIVLLNNDGGGIFSFLPQAAHAEHFELLFGTPHGLDFRPAVEMYGGRFERVTEWPAFRDAVGRALRAPGLKVIEMPTERRRNVELHRRVWPAVTAAIHRPDGVVRGRGLPWSS
ncbi:MAG TPA: 2-succinyl-5-enolpyruvyl-6-hydroxy-3-cyclohexene-1-carboxylic-acid synthase [Chloroflexota bacterium]|nr:2-succinyl-5-enolpyruvyl-6-hydroxy-3-cyclohexene-1-carboxylic-acid synthase [Chloroflexota bacterium]